MVDLHRQYLRLRPELDLAMQEVMDTCAFINGPQVQRFASHLSSCLDVPYVIPCGNGTDALQIALMALDLKPGDEVIVPAFTYVAAAEVVSLLGLIPVDLFWHGFVEAAQAGFDMYYRNMQFTGSQRSGQCRIGVSIYDYIIRPVFRQDLFDFDKHLSGHRSMRGMSAMQLPGRTCHIHFGEENTAHVLVVTRNIRIIL